MSDGDPQCANCAAHVQPWHNPRPKLLRLHRTLRRSGNVSSSNIIPNSGNIQEIFKKIQGGLKLGDKAVIRSAAKHLALYGVLSQATASALRPNRKGYDNGYFT
jgi:hypothetical protein